MFYYILYRCGHLLACILPVNISYRLAEFLTYIKYIFSRKERRTVIENLKFIYNGDESRAKKNCYEVFKNFGLYLVDFFRISKLNQNFIENFVEVKGIENLQEALRGGKGVVVLTAHLGNWEMGGVILSMLGYNISAAALTHSYKEINDFFIQQRGKKGLKIIPVNSSPKKFISVLKQGNILALLGDRDFSNTGSRRLFFKKETNIPKGPALFSLKLNSPIVPGFFVRKDRYKYEFIFDEPFLIKNGRDFEAALEATMQNSVEVMEKYIRLYPTQWLVFRPFWEVSADVFIV